MSIQSEINRINSNIASTYSALEQQGAAMPAALNSDNLAATVATLSNGTKVYYVEGTGTTAGVWTGSIDGLTAYYDGLAILYKINIAGATATTLNINGLGAITCRRNAGALTTHVPVNSVILLTYTTIDGTGYFTWADYDSNTKVTQAAAITTAGEYPVMLGYSTATTAVTNTLKKTTTLKYNPSTKVLTAPTVKGNLTGNADTATKASQDANGNNIAATYATKAEVAEKAVPDYVVTEAERLAALVQTRQGENTMTMMFGSDVHLSLTNANSAQMVESVTHAGQAMDILKKSVHIDFSAILGDLIWDGDTNEVGTQTMRKVHSLLGEHDFWTEGNHDCQYNGETITRQQKFANTGKWNEGAVYDGANRLGGYCYRDYSAYKVRVICLNTCEDTTGDMTISTAQLNWLAGAISTMADGWKCVLLSHHPLNWLGNSTAVMNTVATYKDKVLCNIHGHAHCYLVAELGTTGVKRITIPNINFYRNNEYGTNGATEYGGVENGESTTYNKTADSANDTAFCVLTLDLDNMIIYADRYGAGYDRVISLEAELETFTVTNSLTKTSTSNSATTAVEGSGYTATLTADSGYELSTVKVTMGGTDVTSSVYSNGKITISSVTGDIVITAVSTEAVVTPTYTNLVPTSLASGGGSVYNSTGYKNGYRLNSSGTETALTGAACTGFIPYNDQVIRLFGSKSKYLSDTGWYIQCYDSSFAHSGGVAGSGISADTTFAVHPILKTADGSNAYMWTIDPNSISNATIKNYLLNAVYIRISAPSCAGSDMIVTFDEPIE